MKTPLSFKILRSILQPVSWIAPGVVGRYWADFFMSTQRHARPGWEQEILKKGEAFELSGGIRAWSFGQGPLVLLAHGWDGRGSQLGRFIEPLTKAGLRVVTFDALAHGDSPGTWNNLGVHARTLLSISDELKVRYGPLHAVIAHSFGAGATALAASLGLEVSRVVLIASPSSIQKVIDRFAEFIKMSPKAKAVLQKRVEQSAGFKAERAEVGRLAKDFSHIPALVFHDPDDNEVPFSEAESIVKNWEGARLVSVPKVGHRRILKHEPVIEETVRFLSV